MLDHPITLRLTHAQRAQYEAAARSAGQPLGVWLRARLERDDAVLAALERMRAQMADPPRGPAPAGPAAVVERASGGAASGAPDAVALECLLLLRALAGPARMQMAQGEVRRAGLTPWGGES